MYYPTVTHLSAAAGAWHGCVPAGWPRSASAGRRTSQQLPGHSPRENEW